MKRILSLVLTMIMLASVLVVDTGAAATLVHGDDFNTGFAPRNWFVDDSCAFYWDKENQCIHGYSDALVLQTKFTAPYNKVWDKFYTSFDVQIRADDDATEEGQTPDTSVAIWYKDQMDVGNGVPDITYMFHINVQTGDAKLTKTVSFTYKDENGITQDGKIDDVIATANIGEKIDVGENAKWFNMGMRVDSGKIECYYNETLLFSLEAKDTDEKLGDYALKSVDASVGSVPSAILFWNFGNWVALDNFVVWTPDYNFDDSNILYGDVDGNDAVNLLDVSAMMKSIAGWTNVTMSEPAADVDGSGKVNLIDVGLVMKSIAKWDVVLGPQA